MTMNAPYSMSRERNVILASLLVLAAAAWAVLIWQPGMLSSMGNAPRMGLTQGMNGALFLTMWVVMMIAMMFPTAAPMILMFTRVHSARRQRGWSFVPTWVFVAGYIVVWALFGVLAYVVALAIEGLANESMWLMQNAARIGGLIFVLAGLYQLSPLKHACLSKCRTPLAFILSSWRQGFPGAFLMGLEHGVYCLGCCWLLFAILFPLGVMNVAAMAIITLLIFAEKSLPIGRRMAQVAAVALIVYGTLAVFIPTLVPM